MKILIVTQYFYPETFRINDVCFQLVKEGHQVTVLTGLPNYPEGKIKDEYRFFRKRKEVIQGVDVIRVPLIGRGKSKYTLMLNYASFAFFGSMRALFLSGFDVVYSYEVSPITQVIPAFFVRKKGKLVVNCLDLWPESITAIGMKTEGKVYEMIRKLSSWIYRKADTIIIPSRGFKEYLVDICQVYQERIHYVPNHAEEDYLRVQDKTSFTNEKLHLLFAGNIGRAQNLDIIVEATSLLKQDVRNEIVIDIVGDGSYLSTLKQKVAEYKIEKYFAFHGRCDIQEVIQYYEIADACLMTLAANSFVSKTVPAKLQGYMASGRMILAAINGSSVDIIQEANCGLVSEASDAQQFANNITDFVQNKVNYTHYGQNGRNYFLANYTIEKHIINLMSYWEDTNNVQK